MHARTEELIHAEIDGVISAADRAELERRLAADVEAGERLEELRALTRSLAGDRDEPVPPTLRAEIVRAVEGAKVVRFPQRRRYMAFAAVFALLAVAVGYFGTRFSDGTEKASGTFVLETRFEESELFEDLMQNPALRERLDDPSFIESIEERRFRELLRDPAVRERLTDPEFIREHGGR